MAEPPKWPFRALSNWHGADGVCSSSPASDQWLPNSDRPQDCLSSFLGQFEILSDPNRFRAMTQGLWNAPARRSIQNLLATLAPSETVVHVHLWAKALSSSVISAGREMGFSIVFTLHDYLYSCPTGTLFNHRTQAPCTLKPMSLNCLTTNCDARNFVHKSWRVLRHGVQQQFGGFDKGFDRYIALTRHSREILRAAIPDDSRIHFIPNFVDLPACQPAPVAENRRFIFSGRLVPEKGPLLFAEAAPGTQASRPFSSAMENAGSACSPPATTRPFSGGSTRAK